MTLLSMYQRDDSRNVYKILADEAVKYIDHPKEGPEAKILFTSLARLLERYRYDAFYFHGAPGILEVLEREPRTQRANRSELAAKTLDVIPALETAHARVYRALSKDDLVETLQRLLGTLARSAQPQEAHATEELEKARCFFVILGESLQQRNT
jgi:hypothetical protein